MPYVQHDRGLGPETKGSCMTRSTLRLLLASVVAALALVVAACGGSDNSSVQRLELLGRGSAASQETGGKQGGILTPARLVRRRLPRPGPHVLHGRLPGRLSDAAAAVQLQARQRDGPGPGPRGGQAADLRRPEDDHGQDQAGREVQPAGQPRGDARRTSSTPSSASSPSTSAASTPSYFSSIEGAPTAPTKGVKPISGITTPDDQTIVFKLKRAAGRRRRRRRS